jgi:hypothetical protein
MLLPFEDLILQDYFLKFIFFIVSFFLLGLLVKFIDDAFDEKAYSRKIALIFSPITAIFWAYIMSLDPAAALLLTAIIIGVLVKGKIDNVAFVIAVLCVYLVYFFVGDWQFIFNLSFLIVLIIISIGGILDEIGNDFVDKNNLYKKGFFGKIIHWFFEYRFIMKIVVLFFALIGAFDILFFIAFFFWDLGYEVIMHYSRYILRKRKFYYDKKANGY